MRIVALIKQVPDMAEVKFDVGKGRLDRTSAEAEINLFDLNVLETALQIKEKLGGVITAISMGPQHAESALRNAIARGADRGILLVDEAFSGADTLATSYTLASAIRKLGEFDLIICGEKAVDGNTGQVGPEVAEHLGIPHVAYVSKLVEVGEKLVVVCDMEGVRYSIQTDFPALITVTRGINTPRLPSLRNKLNSRKAKVDVWDAEALSSGADRDKFGEEGSHTMVYKSTMIPSGEGRKGKIFRGAVDELVKGFIAEIKDAGILGGIVK